MGSRASSSLLAADLFSGAGGLSEGLRQAGFRVTAAADHDPDACATYRRNFPHTELVEGDLTDTRVHSAFAEAASADGRLDLLVGGPPCQAYSQVRNHDRLLDDPRNRLYREFVELLAELRPRALLVENVVGLQQLGHGAVRQQIEEDLSLEGEYTVFSAVVDAADLGVPQRRPRLVFVGVENGQPFPLLPRGTGIAQTQRLIRVDTPEGTAYQVDCADPSLLAKLLDPGDATAVTASQALSDLAEPGETYSQAPESAYQAMMRQGSDGPQDHVPSRTRADTARRLEAIPPGGNVYDLPEELLARYLGKSRWGPAGNGKRLSRRHYYAYRRLHPDALAWTANTKADFAYHYGPPRGLSVREAARIQGFPDRFHFTTAAPGTPGQLKNGARHSRYRQVGNAVPPPLARAIGEAVAVQVRAGQSAQPDQETERALAA